MISSGIILLTFRSQIIPQGTVGGWDAVGLLHPSCVKHCLNLFKSSQMFYPENKYYRYLKFNLKCPVQNIYNLPLIFHCNNTPENTREGLISWRVLASVKTGISSSTTCAIPLSTKFHCSKLASYFCSTSERPCLWNFHHYQMDKSRAQSTLAPNCAYHNCALNSAEILFLLCEFVFRLCKLQCNSVGNSD